MSWRNAALALGLWTIGGVGIAAAAPPPDPASIITLQMENDATGGTDRYYTSGLHLGWTLPTDAVPGFLATLGHAVWGEGQQRISLGLSQPLFTPQNTQISPPDPQDRPYAGLLFGTLSLIQDTDRTRSVMGLDLGVIGPAALGEQVQNGFHTLIGQHPNRGWGFQLPNQPLVQVFAGRTWRLPLAAAGPLEVDALPQLEGGLGTWRIAAQAGALLRVGQGLNADFGAPRMRPGLTGEDAYHSTRPVSWYVFAGGDGQAVAYDETLDGEPFASTRHVSSLPFVGEMEAGIAVIVFGVRVTFSDVIQTHQFRGQFGGLFHFGSASVAFRF